MTPEESLQLAKQYAEQAARTAGGLKGGSYDSVKALALTSIAHSLTILAGQAGQTERPSS